MLEFFVLVDNSYFILIDLFVFHLFDFVICVPALLEFDSCMIEIDSSVNFLEKFLF